MVAEKNLVKSEEILGKDQRNLVTMDDFNNLIVI